MHELVRKCISHRSAGACGCMDSALDKIRRSGVRFPVLAICAKVSDKFHIPHFLGPPSHNGYLVHSSKVGSIVANGKVNSVEHALSWHLASGLSLPKDGSSLNQHTHYQPSNNVEVPDI